MPKRNPFMADDDEMELTEQQRRIYEREWGSDSHDEDYGDELRTSHRREPTAAQKQRFFDSLRDVNREEY